MTAKFNTSFIPKKTLSDSEGKKEEGKMPAKPQMSGLGGGEKGGRNKKTRLGGVNRSRALSGGLFFLGIFAFLISGALAGGLFAWEYYLQNTISSKSTQLESTQKEISVAVIQKLKQAETRFTKAEELLAEHRALTPFFDFLENNTLRAVSFDSLSYAYENGAHTLKLDGVAKNYESLLYQSRVFRESPAIVDAVFSSLKTNKDGQIGFSATLQLNPAILSYASTLETGTMIKKTTQ